MLVQLTTEVKAIFESQLKSINFPNFWSLPEVPELT